tara:strand:+ start:652 stop:1932 length:1281 start_codon:yes stop_codon:yes gene_type:complete
MKQIPINYIQIDDKIDSIRKIDEVAIGRYVEKYESGTSKAILVKRITKDKYILIDGKHRIEAKKKLEQRKIDCELFDGEDIYSKAVECNQEHGIPLTKEEEEKVILNFIDAGKSDEEIGKVFHLARRTINNKINSNQTLKKARVAKSKVPTINYFLDGEKQVNIAKDLRLSEGAISQRINNWLDEINDDYNTGSTKQEIIAQENEKGIKLTLKKLNEFIEEDCNKLIIGDCLKEIPKLDNEIIDCLIIDPPYGMNYQSNHRKEKYNKISNDNKKAFILLDSSLKLVKEKMKRNSHIYIFTSWKVIDKVKPIIEKYFKLKNCLVWNKNNWSMGDLEGNYAEKYELILFATLGKKKLYCDKRPLNVLDFARTNNEEHPTQKPVELLKEFIKNSTKENELVVDYFAGSGSTLIAAKELNRRWLGIEIKK